MFLCSTFWLFVAQFVIKRPPLILRGSYSQGVGEFFIPKSGKTQ